jgi:hypothetical protein
MAKSMWPTGRVESSSPTSGVDQCAQLALTVTRGERVVQQAEQLAERVRVLEKENAALKSQLEVCQLREAKGEQRRTKMLALLQAAY